MCTQKTPFVSVIMPIRNESDFIARSVGAVLAQDYSHNQMEILIADGMSDDETREIIQEIALTSDIPITIIDNLGRIVPTGFNVAMQHARGDFIFRVDGHCEIATNHITVGAKILQEQDVSGVGGPIETVSQNTIGSTIAVAMSSTFGVGGSAFRTVKDKVMLADTIAFPAYKRTVMNEAGPLDEEMVRNQDDEYNYRLRSLGHKLLLTPDMKSRYYSRASIKKLWNQYYQYGLYKVRVLQKHPAQMRIRQFIPPLFVGSLLGGTVLASISKPLRSAWYMIIVVYTLVNLAASFATAWKSGWKHLPLLPIVFATLHLSYGLGFLRGLIKFWNRWHDR